MKKGNSNVFTLGLDGLDITINTDVKLEQNHYTFKNQAGKELGNLAAVKNGYKLHLCLPKMVRNNNSIPFGVSDYKHEYSCAMKSHFRKSGNQMSGKWKSSHASLLA